MTVPLTSVSYTMAPTFSERSIVYGVACM